MRYFPLRSWKDSKVNFSYLAKTNKGKAHTGLDLDCTDIWEDCNGLPDVLSVDDGTVFKTGYDADGWGNFVVVKNHDGLFCIYAHLEHCLVAKGEPVIGCAPIGVMGSTGNSTGPHLHFEIRSDYYNAASHISPADYLGIKNATGACRWTD